MSSSPPSSVRRVSVIVPVKRLDAAKTRTHLSAPERAELTLALMTRTVSAALAAARVAQVIVVAGDDTIAVVARSLGAIALREPAMAGLNGAIAAGREFARREFPEDDIAVVVGDLAEPAAADLDLAIAQYHRTDTPLAVPDHLGTGTTMLIHGVADDPPLLFGVDSARRHREAGYRLFNDAPASIRRDVDGPLDLIDVKCDAHGSSERRLGVTH